MLRVACSLAKTSCRCRIVHAWYCRQSSRMSATSRRMCAGLTCSKTSSSLFCEEISHQLFSCLNLWIYTEQDMQASGTSLEEGHTRNSLK